MASKGKIGIAALVIFLAASHLSGQIKAKGNMVIPTASGKKEYKAVITINREEIGIECSERIFQLFNEFNTPRYRRIKANTAELEKIVSFENEIYILPKNKFYQRYRNIFNPVKRIVSYIPYKEEKEEAIIFILDNPEDIGDKEKELLKTISHQEKEN